MEKQLLMSVMAIGVAAAGMGAGTFAFFTDTADSSDNIFTAATIDLHLNGGESVTGTITSGNMLPGDSAEGSIDVSQVGTAPDANLTVDLAFDIAETDGEAHGVTDGAHVAENLVINTLTYGGSNLLTASCWTTTVGGTPGALADSNSDGEFTLNELEGQACVGQSASDSAVVIKVTLDAEETGNNAQGDEADLTIRFLLRQTIDGSSIAP